jgi:hypothetical protein
MIKQISVSRKSVERATFGSVELQAIPVLVFGDIQFTSRKQPGGVGSENDRKCVNLRE